MGRKAGQKNRTTLEYQELHDELVLEFGCPVFALFKIANGQYKPEHRINAAKVLVAQRFAKPQPKPENNQGELTLVWSGDNVENINTL